MKVGLTKLRMKEIMASTTEIMKKKRAQLLTTRLKKDILITKFVSGVSKSVN